MSKSNANSGGGAVPQYYEICGCGRALTGTGECSECGFPICDYCGDLCMVCFLEHKGITRCWYCGDYRPDDGDKCPFCGQPGDAP